MEFGKKGMEQSVEIAVDVTASQKESNSVCMNQTV